MGDLLLGCSGWSYADPVEKGGWTGAFYPDSKTRRLAYYSNFFNTAEIDSTFYEKFYSQMTKGTFYGMVKATPENFQFSVKVPETVTHDKRLKRPSRMELKHTGLQATTTSWHHRQTANHSFQALAANHIIHAPQAEIGISVITEIQDFLGY
jgi:uncharacterized protein YecE (DUF72 family)